MNYPEEIEAYLAPQLNASSRSVVLTQISNEYFVGSGLIGGNGAHCREAGDVETLIEGIREIYYWATRHNSSPMEWEQVRQSMQAFVLDEMRNLKGNDTALAHFCKGLNDDADWIQRALIRQVEMGAVRIQRPKLSPMEFISVQSLSILGISDTSHPRKSLPASIHAHSCKRLDSLFYRTGCLSCVLRWWPPRSPRELYR